MNNPFLNPEDIISGTESGYIEEIYKPLPVLNLYDRLKPKYKLELNKSIDKTNYTTPLQIKNKLKNTISYQDLTIQEIKMLYSYIGEWYCNWPSRKEPITIDDLIFGYNLFEK